MPQLKEQTNTSAMGNRNSSKPCKDGTTLTKPGHNTNYDILRQVKSDDAEDSNPSRASPGHGECLPHSAQSNVTTPCIPVQTNLEQTVKQCPKTQNQNTMDRCNNEDDDHQGHFSAELTDESYSKCYTNSHSTECCTNLNIKSSKRNVCPTLHMNLTRADICTNYTQKSVNCVDKFPQVAMKPRRGTNVFRRCLQCVSADDSTCWSSGYSKQTTDDVMDNELCHRTR